MKPSFLKLGMVAAMLLVASSAFAAGVRLSWQNCAGDGLVQNRTFACNLNTGSDIIVGSFILDADLLQVNGNELVVDLITQAAPVLPDWWTFTFAGACRQLSLAIAAQDGGNCPDMFSGQASMNIAAYQTKAVKPDLPADGGARILCVNAVQFAAIADLAAGQEYGIAKWTINHQKSVGTGSCAGCATPVCIVFNSANITTEQVGVNVRLQGPANPGDNIITFQGAGADCQAVPTKNATWGAVKSLYR
jgi:hypothetical protein